GRPTEQIFVQSLVTRERHAVIDGRAAQFADGYLVFARGSRILAAPFDLAKLVVSGTPRPLLDRILAWNAGPLVSVSRVGSVAYVPPVGVPDSVLKWVDRAGTERSLPGARSALSASSPRAGRPSRGCLDCAEVGPRKKGAICGSTNCFVTGSMRSRW